MLDCHVEMFDIAKRLIMNTLEPQNMVLDVTNFTEAISSCWQPLVSGETR
jgi:hypothetical protein